ncbi:hypothetical protein KR49_13080 [Synechococcus sp. KORDI-49]|nr:hypothetical protein KR49_13080 [Synechococcus sp. KORDI-49]
MYAIFISSISTSVTQKFILKMSVDLLLFILI